MSIFRNWIAAASLDKAINLLGVCNRLQQRSALPLPPLVVDDIVAMARTCDDDVLATVPLLLRQRGLLSTEPGAQMLSIALERVSTLSSDASQRLLWDIAAFAPDRAEDVVGKAKDLLGRGPDVLGDWNWLCIGGTAIMLGCDIDVPIEASRVVSGFTGDVFELNDRFRVARALLTASRVAPLQALEPAFITRAIRIFDDTAAEGLSLTLIEQARTLLRVA